MEHTKGPWEVQPSSNPGNGSNWRDIVSLGEKFSPSYIGEAMERDAALIASAPAMLAALEGLLDFVDKIAPVGMPYSEEYAQAVNAVKSARGG